MIYVRLTLGWVFPVIFRVLTVSMLLMINWLPAAVLLLIVLLVLPPVSPLIRARFNWPIHIVLRFALIAVLLFLFVRLLTGGERTSIYNSPEVEARFLEIYDEKMNDWPVPYEDVFIDTKYGRVHVIVSEPQEAPPLPLSAEQRQSFKVPLMFVFGERDNLVGDPEAAKALVQDIPDVRAETVAAGHLMGAEIPEQVNALIMDFFAED